MVTTVELPSSGQWDLASPRGLVYRIQVAWPLDWQERAGHKKVPVLYLVDGNALFLTASEAAWRRGNGPNYQDGGVVVAIGYPALQGRLYSPRRNYDLTPPGGAADPAHWGGADHLLDFIETTLKPFLATEILPGLVPSREALFGHSFGGLFALYALFTRPTLFDAFLAASPSIWWDDSLILEYEKHFVEGPAAATQKDQIPSLWLTCGTYEQDPPQWPREPDADYQRRRAEARARAMLDNVRALRARLRDVPRLSTVLLNVYPAEDHGTVIAPALSRTLATFFEEWPVDDDTWKTVVL